MLVKFEILNEPLDDDALADSQDCRQLVKPVPSTVVDAQRESRCVLPCAVRPPCGWVHDRTVMAPSCRVVIIPRRVATFLTCSNSVTNRLRQFRTS